MNVFTTSCHRSEIIDSTWRRHCQKWPKGNHCACSEHHPPGRHGDTRCRCWCIEKNVFLPHFLVDQMSRLSGDMRGLAGYVSALHLQTPEGWEEGEVGGCQRSHRGRSGGRRNLINSRLPLIIQFKLVLRLHMRLWLCEVQHFVQEVSALDPKHIRICSVGFKEKHSFQFSSFQCRGKLYRIIFILRASDAQKKWYSSDVIWAFFSCSIFMSSLCLIWEG